MAAKTGIEWTDATWNPIVGCSVVSPGCKNCYAMKMAARIEAMARGRGETTHYAGTTQPSKAGAVWTDKLALAPDQILLQPLRWRAPRRIFVNSMGDLFHEDVPDEWIDKVFAIMALCPQHTFQVLTKRAERMRDYFSLERWELEERIRVGAKEISALVHPHSKDLAHCTYMQVGLRGCSPFFPLDNVWLGVSVEDQTRADERIPLLLDTPAAVRFLSCEPLLGPVDLAAIKLPPVEKDRNYELCALSGRWIKWTGKHPRDWVAGTEAEMHGSSTRERMNAIDWVIAGGESGSAARPMHPDWARGLRNQCVAENVPFFFKQWGEWVPLENPMPHVDKIFEIHIEGIGKVDHHRFDNGYICLREGKRKTGRMLDGRTWDEIPGRPE